MAKIGHNDRMLMSQEFVSYTVALQLALDAITPLDSEQLPLGEIAGHVAAASLYALVDSPSANISLKDGYALRAADTAQATPAQLVSLAVIGAAAAGVHFAGDVTAGAAVKIFSGAIIPPGTDAVVAVESVQERGERVVVMEAAAPGDNILPQGNDIQAGEFLVDAGAPLSPAQIGLLTAAGYSQIPVIRQPQIAIIATGDELLSPDDKMQPGRLYASNLAMLAGWCKRYGLASSGQIVKDDAQAIERALVDGLAGSDALITSGGAWQGERDLVIGLLDRLGWQKIYRQVKIAPGKGIGFGLWQGKPVFCLPGGPPANQTAFIQLALPALLKLAGYRQPHLPEMTVKLAAEVTGRPDWTQFVEGRLAAKGTDIYFHPLRLASRLQSMAQTEAILAIPEGEAAIPAGAEARVQRLTPGSVNSPPADTAWPDKPLIISFVAKSGSGKTTFLTKLIPELKARGVAVGALKHHAHATPFDVPGKDTYRMAEAGAEVVAAICPIQTAVFRQENGSASYEQVIARELGHLDLVLIEGLKQSHYPKIEVHRAARSEELLCQMDELLAVVSDNPLIAPQLPCFDLEDVTAVADFLCSLGARP